MKTFFKIALPLLALLSLAGMTVEILKLMEIGTCASGNTPYVIANECPSGTGTTIAILSVCIVVFTLVTFPIGFGDFAAGVFWFGLLFVVLGAAFVYSAMTSDTSGAGVGYIIGPIFLLMGIFPLVLGSKEMIASLGDSDDDPKPSPLAAGIRPATGQTNKSGIATGGPTFGATTDYTPVAVGAGMTPAPTGAATHTAAKAAASGIGKAAGKPPSATEFVEQVKELDKLRQAGALTQSEFEAAKSKLLRGE